MAKEQGEFARGCGVILAAAAGCGLGLSALPFYGLGPLMTPLGEEFGWSRTEISIAFTFMTLGLLIAGPVIVGRLSDRIGVRAVALTSIPLFALSLLALQFLRPAPEGVPGPALLWLGYLAMAFFGAGTSPITYTRAVNAWFDRNRGLALGLTLAGTGAMGIVLPMILGRVAPEFGWRGGFVTLAILAALAWPIVALLLKNAPPAGLQSQSGPAPGASLGEAVKNYRFWALGLAFLILALGIAGLVVHLFPMLTDAGLTPQEAGGVAALIGVGVIVGRIVIGFLVDRFFGPLVAIVVFLITAVGCVMLADGGIAIAPYAAFLIGFALGAEVDLIAYFTSRYFGIKRYGEIYGWQYGFYGVGAAFAPVLMGALFAAGGGTYTLALHVSAGLCVIACLLLSLLGRYPRFELDPGAREPSDKRPTTS
ncbi:MAG: MFS transporter [Alphaproteobacteria bacterium]|nr:MFS transporter [Alphaproteobacteria bacterium]